MKRGKTGLPVLCSFRSVCRIISEIINSNDERVLNAVKSLLNIEDEVDFWEGLSAEERAAIDEGLEQLDKGEHVSHKSVREEIKKRFNF